MKKIVFVLIGFFVFSLNTINGQSPKEMVALFFKSMYDADTISLKNLFITEPSFHSSSLNKKGEKVITKATLKDFCKSIGSLKKGEADERVSNLEELIAGETSTVSMDYNLFYKGTFMHCGVNVFHFLKDNNGWKITGIDDTRNRANCNQTFALKAEKLLDDWHMAATKADSASYFGMLSDKSIFVGTDSSEVWTKAQFAKYAGPYFAKGKAWDFKKVSRHMHYEKERNMVWFDEMLATWMGPCRGSGWISIDENGQMKIEQYVLSMTIPNDDVDSVIELLKGKVKK